MSAFHLEKVQDFCYRTKPEAFCSFIIPLVNGLVEILRIAVEFVH